jgi:hypothetical protein
MNMSRFNLNYPFERTTHQCRQFPATPPHYLLVFTTAVLAFEKGNET